MRSALPVVWLEGRRPLEGSLLMPKPGVERGCCGGRAAGNAPSVCFVRRTCSSGTTFSSPHHHVELRRRESACGRLFSALRRAIASRRGWRPPGPARGEVVVRLMACACVFTDLKRFDGSLPQNFPFETWARSSRLVQNLATFARFRRVDRCGCTLLLLRALRACADGEQEACVSGLYRVGWGVPAREDTPSTWSSSRPIVPLP